MRMRNNSYSICVREKCIDEKEVAMIPKFSTKNIPSHLLIVEYLVNHPLGIKQGLLTSKNKQDMTCLQLACSEGHLCVVEYLLNFERGPDDSRRKDLISMLKR
jgi:hypothetical protein